MFLNSNKYFKRNLRRNTLSLMTVCLTSLLINEVFKIRFYLRSRRITPVLKLECYATQKSGGVDLVSSKMNGRGTARLGVILIL